MLQTDQTKYYDGNRPIAPKLSRHFQVAEMRDTHHEIARRLVLGQKQKVIAEELGISYQTVNNVKNSPVVQEQIMMLRGARDQKTIDVRAQIDELAPKCVQLLKEQLEDDHISPNLKSRNAFQLLAISGHSPVRQINMRSVSAILSGDDIERIKMKALAAAEKAGVIDID